MKKKLLAGCVLLGCSFAKAQNVGIGIPGPLAKLHIANGLSGATPIAPTSLGGLGTLIPGLTHTFTISGNTKVFINYTVNAFAEICPFCVVSNVLVMINITGLNNVSTLRDQLSNGEYRSLNGCYMQTLGPGTYTIKITAVIADGPDVTFNYYDGRMVLQMIAE